MAYLSLYRKYRSQTFGDLVGQDHVVRTLQNAIESERISHAYLFTGPRGTGKTSTARLLAKALCCVNGPTTEPCNICDQCIAITTGMASDVQEMDAASESGVDDVRDKIVEVAEYKPMFSRYKVFIIDEVHDLSRQAFDALLKMIEEPPEHVIFILATTEYNKVPPTIRSRCQKFEFHRGSLPDLVHRLEHVVKEEGIEAEPAALSAIARMADGGFRDALTLLEQAIITSEGKIEVAHVYDQLGLINEEVVDGLLLAMVEGDVPRIVDLLSEVGRLGRDPRAVLESSLYRLSDLTRAAYGLDAGSVVDAPREAVTHETAAKIGRENLLKLRSAMAEAHKVIREITLPRLWLECELMRIAGHLGARPAKVVEAERPPAVAPAKPKPESNGHPAEKPPTAKVEKPTERQKQAPEPDAGAVISAPAPANPGHETWARVLQSLPPQTAIAFKLATSRAEIEGRRARVFVDGQMTLDWIMSESHPGRRGMILKSLLEQTGEEWTVTYFLADKSEVRSEPETVELALEGQKLQEAVREVFNS